jgi:DnaK suppressor protein
MAKESERRRQQQLQKIKVALKRIEENDFGYCSVCDEEIDIRRLELDPANSHCISCAE